MDAKQEAKLNMYRTTENYCSENSAIIFGNPAFMAAFDNFKAKIAAINSAAQQDAVVITGITADKNLCKQKLCQSVAQMASVIYAFASTVGNNTLKEEVNVTFSELMKTRDDALAPRCQNIHTAGTNNLGDLQDYGITRESLDALQAAINVYSSETPKPRTAISQRKTVTANLALLFEETDKILKERMDKLVLVFKAAHPNFVKTYEATRRIVKPPTTHTQLKGTITDKATKTPVKNATITAAPKKNGTTPLVTQSDAAGNYHFKPIPHGECAVTVTADGYQTFQTDIELIMGEINDLDIELVK